MRKYLYVCLAAMIVASAGFAAWLVLSMGTGRQHPESVMPLTALDVGTDYAEVDAPYSEYDDEIEVIAVISPTTRMIFDYYDSDGDFETITEYPSPFILGMTEGELATMFADWHLLSFSPNEVHLRQNPQIEYRRFIIGVHEGYIAVFYDDEFYNIKELTSRPVTALAAEEQQRLLEGIRVTGNEELMRALEDFSS